MFEYIPEDETNKRESYPCECGGNIVKEASCRWECDRCDRKYFGLRYPVHHKPLKRGTYETFSLCTCGGEVRRLPGTEGKVWGCANCKSNSFSAAGPPIAPTSQLYKCSCGYDLDRVTPFIWQCSHHKCKKRMYGYCMPIPESMVPFNTKNIPQPKYVKYTPCTVCSGPYNIDQARCEDACQAKLAKPKKEINMSQHEEGDKCPENKYDLAWECQGTLQIVHPDEGGCSCHLGMPPCSYCTTTTLECDECHWSETETH